MKTLLTFTAFLAAGFLLGSRRAAKPVVVEFKLHAADFVALSRQHDYRAQVVEEPALCRADIDAVQARKDAGEVLTHAELRTLYNYQKTL